MITMPLPVERSQGSVQSLVARFQTAANKDAEFQRRQSLPPTNSRRVSGVPAGSIPTDGSPAKKPDHEAGNEVISGEASVKGQGAVPGSTGQSQAVDVSPAEIRAETKDINGNHRDRKDEVDKEPKKPASSAAGVIKDKVENVLHGMKDLTVGGSSKAKDANQAMGKDTAAPLASNASASAVTEKTGKENVQSEQVSTVDKARRTKSPVVPKPPFGSSELEGSKEGQTVALKQNGKDPITGSSKADSTPNVSTVKSTAHTPTVEAPSKPNTSTPSKATTNKDASKSSTKPVTSTTIVKPTATPKASSSTTSTSREPRVPRASLPPATPSGPTPNRTPRLVPAMTGPQPRRSPSNLGNNASNGDLTPLRPQLTGTPSRPTASYLAKTRTPHSTTVSNTPATKATPAAPASSTSGARRSSHGSSLGKSAGAAKARTSFISSPSPASGQPGGEGRRASISPEARKSGFNSTPSATPSSSRLMQGTAASRARAAEKAVSPLKATKTGADVGTGSNTGSVGRSGGSGMRAKVDMKKLSSQSIAPGQGHAKAPSGDSVGGSGSGTPGPVDSQTSPSKSTQRSSESNGTKGSSMGDGGSEVKDVNSEVYTPSHNDEDDIPGQRPIGTTDEDGFPRMPGGARLGFAAAGMGKGGKTGAAYNEEVNEGIRHDANAPKEEHMDGNEEGTRVVVKREENSHEVSDVTESKLEFEAVQGDQEGAGIDGDIADTERNPIDAKESSGGPTDGAAPSKTVKPVDEPLKEEGERLEVEGEVVSKDQHQRDDEERIQDIPDI